MSFNIFPKLFRKCSIAPCVSILKGYRCTHSITVKDILNQEKPIGSNLKLKCWVKRHRGQRDLVFLHVTDGSTLKPLQVVSTLSCLNGEVSYGSCVELCGTLVESPGKGQAVEIKAEQINVIGLCDTLHYPIKFKVSHSMNYLRHYIHLRNRSEAFTAMLRVRGQATQAIHQHYQKNGYLQVHTPILTSNDCEGAGEVFQVEPADKDILKGQGIQDSSDDDTDIEESSTDTMDTVDMDTNSTDRQRVESNEHFFKVPTFLTVSGQLHLEIMTGSFPKVYTFSPTFRAENSRTRHHLSEFYMVEAEITFTESVEDLCQSIESLVKDTTQSVLHHNQEDVEYFYKHSNKEQHMVNIEKLIEKPFIRLDYTEAIKLLQQHAEQGKFEHKPEWGLDLRKEHEKWLVSYCDNYPVFILNFPKSLKPFYARVNDDNPNTVAAVDLLAPNVGEICGGSLREERYDVISNRLHELELHHSLDWYLDLRRFGSAPHGGYGLGFERYLQTLLGIANIKDTIPFPRSTHNCKL